MSRQTRLGAAGRITEAPVLPLRLRRSGAILLGLALILSACASPSTPTESPVIATPEPSRPEPTGTVSPSFPYPAAMLLFDPANGGLELVGQDGVVLANLGTIVWADLDPRRGAVLGALGGQFGRVRYAYLAPREDVLELNVRSAIGTVSLGDFASQARLAGSTPAGLLAVSSRTPAEAPDQTASALFIVDPVRRTGMDRPVVEGLPPGVVPLRLQLEDEQPTGVVYCVLHSEDKPEDEAPCYGLYRVDIASGEVEPMVADDLAIVALSPDLRIAALASSDRVPPDVRVRNLETGTEIVFRSEAGVREIGGGAISPAGTRLAWVSLIHQGGGEASPAVGLASASGGPITLLGTASLSEALGAPVTRVRPVGWLDEARLLLELSTSRSTAVYVLLMGEGRMDHVAPGRLAGFVYR